MCEGVPSLSFTEGLVAPCCQGVWPALQAFSRLQGAIPLEITPLSKHRAIWYFKGLAVETL